MGLAEVKADAQLVRQQLVNLPADKFDAKHELTENILPLFESLVDAIGADLDEIGDELQDHGEALDELIDASSDVLHPETTAKILGVFEIGKTLAAELQKLLPKLDDVAKKRTRELIKTYLQGVQVVSNELAEITLTPDELEERAAAAAAANANDAGEPADGEGDDDADTDDDTKEQG